MTVLTAVGLAVGGSIVSAPAAQADDVPCTIENFSPRSVVVGLTPIVKTFKVSVSDCSLRHWRASSDAFYVYPDSPQKAFDPWSNGQAGSYDVVVDASNADWEERSRVFADGFHLLRRTTWQSGTFNASPEPVKRGRNITVTGRLLVVDWTREKYIPFTGRSVALEFRTTNGTYERVKVVKTNSDGWVRTTVPASTTGVWRLRYGGNSLAGPAVANGDAVKVTR